MVTNETEHKSETGQADTIDTVLLIIIRFMIFRQTRGFRTKEQNSVASDLILVIWMRYFVIYAK